MHRLVPPPLTTVHEDDFHEEAVLDILPTHSNSSNKGETTQLALSLMDCMKKLYHEQQKVKAITDLRDIQLKYIVSKLLFLEGKLLRDKAQIAKLLRNKDETILSLEKRLEENRLCKVCQCPKQTSDRVMVENLKNDTGEVSCVLNTPNTFSKVNDHRSKVKAITSMNLENAFLLQGESDKAKESLQSCQESLAKSPFSEPTARLPTYGREDCPDNENADNEPPPLPPRLLQTRSSSDPDLKSSVKNPPVPPPRSPKSARTGNHFYSRSWQGELNISQDQTCCLEEKSFRPLTSNSLDVASIDLDGSGYFSIAELKDDTLGEAVPSLLISRCDGPSLYIVPASPCPSPTYSNGRRSPAHENSVWQNQTAVKNDVMNSYMTTGVNIISESATLKPTSLQKKPLLYLRSYSTPNEIDYTESISNQPSCDYTLIDHLADLSDSRDAYSYQGRTTPKPWLSPDRTDCGDELINNVAKHFLDGTSSAQQAIYF